MRTAKKLRCKYDFPLFPHYVLYNKENNIDYVFFDSNNLSQAKRLATMQGYSHIAASTNKPQEYHQVCFRGHRGDWRAFIHADVVIIESGMLTYRWA